MIEVECRACLEMSDLEESSSISQNFILDKSFIDVIHLFAPQMVTTIWIGDVICTSCSETLHAFARFLENCIEVEKILKKSEKPKDISASRVTPLDGSFNQNVVLNRRSLEIKSECTPYQLFGKREENKQLQPESIQVKCRTCLGEMSDVQSLSRLTQECLGNKTIKEVIVQFIPQLDPVFWIDDFICANCLKTLDAFAKLMKKCISIQQMIETVKVEEYTLDEVKEIHDEKPNYFSIEPTSTKLDVHITQPTVSSNKPIRTYARKPKSVNQNVGKEIVEFAYKEKPLLTPRETINKLLDGANIKEAQSFLSTTEAIHTYSLSTNKTIQLSESEDNVKQPTDNATENKRCASCGEFFTDSTKCKKCLSMEPTNSKTITNNLSLDSIGDNDEDLKAPAEEVENLYYVQNVVIDFNERFNIVKGDSLYRYRISLHDRVISVAQPNKVLPEFLETFAKHDVPIYHYGLPNKMENKRILLLGKELAQCPECTFKDKNLRAHLKAAHAITLPTALPLNSVLPHKKGQLPVLENDTVYILDYISNPVEHKNTHPCPLCQKSTYSSAKLLMAHMHRVHKDRTSYKCDKCARTFRRKYNYFAHVKEFKKYPTCNVRECYVCSEIVPRNVLSDHIKAHRLYICEICGLSCSSARFLKMHTKTHQNDSTEKTITPKLCPYCGKLKKHIRGHLKMHEDRPRKHKCPKCPKSFMSSHSLKKHDRQTHPKQTYDCNECPRKCKSRQALRDHIQLKHEENYSFSCKICGIKFCRADYLKRHINSHIQGRSTGGQYKYRKHNKLNHTTVPIKCKFCSKSFKTINNLRLHLLSHVKKIRYKCSICDITCSSFSNKYRHEQRHNDPTYELSCKICGQRMKTKEELEQHSKKHEKSRNYKCQLCEKAYARKYLLAHHISVDHTDGEDIEKEKRAILDAALKDYYI